MNSPLKILLVEDNADDEELTLRALRKPGSNIIVEVVRDGQLALERLAPTDSELPGLVLLDLNLPKVNGMDVLRQLRENERTAQLPVVVLCMPDEPTDLRSRHQNLANGFVHKPVTLEALRVVTEEFGLLL